MVIIELFYFVFLAIVGGVVGQWLRIPMGTIIGSMLFVGAGKYFSIVTFEPMVWLSFIVQVSLGIMIGLNFTKMNKKQLHQLGLSLLFIIVSVVFLTVTVGFTVHFFTPIELNIAILSSAPGGMVEMATMAEALNLEAAAVVFLHFVRLLLVMLLFPLVIKFVVQYTKGKKAN